MSEETNEENPKITQEQIEHELRTEPHFQAYFERFASYSVDSFIPFYAQRKKMWLDNGKWNVEQNEKAETQWIEAAAVHLKCILQKKLFDAQCLWRAEKETYEGVEICEDFLRWENDILRCPFLEPIAEHEVELYRQYLLSNNAYVEPDEGRWFLHNWQDYEDLKEAYATDDANRNFPEWYDFHNGRTGAGVLMTLPDVRGPKEDFYLQLAYDKQRAEHAEEWAEHERNSDQRPPLPYDEEHLKYFVTTFEDAPTRRFYEAASHQNRHGEMDEQLMTAISCLLEADEMIPMEGHYDFREAILNTEQLYRLRMIAEHLPIAYEEYLLNHNLGLAPVPKDIVETMTNRANRFRADILQGRRLAGEPEDLNF